MKLRSSQLAGINSGGEHSFNKVPGQANCQFVFAYLVMLFCLARPLCSQVESAASEIFRQASEAMQRGNLNAAVTDSKLPQKLPRLSRKRISTLLSSAKSRPVRRGYCQLPEGAGAKTATAWGKPLSRHRLFSP